MSTLAPLSTAQVCVDTPMVNVRDNRGLTVRTLQYNRHAPTDTVQQLISQQRYGVRGELLSSIDPRLFAEQQVNPGVLANFRYHTSLSGQFLRTKSQDAGDKVVVYDVENGPVWQADSRDQTKRVAYDVLHRPTSVFEQDGPDGSERISECYVYGENEADAVLANARGQLLRNYDTAGLNAVPSYSCTGQPLLQVRRLLRDPLLLTDWQGSEANWVAALDSESFRTQLGYNALGDGVKNVDAKGNQQHQQFNLAGQLASAHLVMAGQAGERPTLTSILYSAAGQILREEAGNGVVTDYTYEPQTQRLSRLLTTRPGLSGREPLLQDLTYSYDPVGNILSIGNAAIAVSYHRNQRIEPANDYQYDALYQLTNASGRENASVGQQGQGLPVPKVPLSADPNQYSQYTRLYTYDRGGNLTQIRHQGRNNYTLDTVVSPCSNHAVQQTGNIMPSDIDAFFDACGNLTQLAPGQPLHWDGRNQLQRVVQVTRPGGDDDAEHYQYDGGGQRVRKTTLSQTSGTQRSVEVIYLPGLELRRTQSRTGTSTTTLEELQMIQAGSAGRQQVRVLHWDSGRPVDMPNDQLRGSVGNQIGSSVLELDQEANLLTLEEYFPYGGTAVWAGSSISETKHKFVRYSGKELDATGLYYYGYRYYVPWLGRWLNPDPAGTIDGLNLFEMVRNNPVVFQDGNGLMRKSTIGKAPARPTTTANTTVSGAATAAVTSSSGPSWGATPPSGKNKFGLYNLHDGTRYFQRPVPRFQAATAAVKSHPLGINNALALVHGISIEHAATAINTGYLKSAYARLGPDGEYSRDMDVRGGGNLAVYTRAVGVGNTSWPATGQGVGSSKGNVQLIIKPDILEKPEHIWRASATDSGGLAPGAPLTKIPGRDKWEYQTESERNRVFNTSITEADQSQNEQLHWATLPIANRVAAIIVHKGVSVPQELSQVAGARNIPIIAAASTDTLRSTLARHSRLDEHHRLL